MGGRSENVRELEEISRCKRVEGKRDGGHVLIDLKSSL